MTKPLTITIIIAVLILLTGCLPSSHVWPSIDIPEPNAPWLAPEWFKDLPVPRPKPRPMPDLPEDGRLFKAHSKPGKASVWLYNRR